MQTKTFILDAIHRLTAVKRLHQCFFFFNVTILFKKCAHNKFGLKIVGTGACLPSCSISSSFQNSLKTSGHRGYEFLELWCLNLVPFLSDICFQPLKSHAVVIAAVCGLALSCWNTHRLERSICCSKTFIYLSAFIVPSKTRKLPTVFTYAPPYHQRCWLLNWTLITRWKVSLLFSPVDTASIISYKNVKFGLVWP